MLADKTLLSVTLAATFTSGMFVGYAVKDTRRAPAADPAVIYAPQLAELAARGYDDAELAEARVVYTEYLGGYTKWWNVCLDTYRLNLDQVDAKKDKRLAELEARHAEKHRAK